MHIHAQAHTHVCVYIHTHQPKVFVGTGYLTKVRGGQRTTFIPVPCMQHPNEVNDPFLLSEPPCGFAQVLTLPAASLYTLFSLPGPFLVLFFLFFLSSLSLLQTCFYPQMMATASPILHSFQLCDSPSSGREAGSLSTPS